MSTSYAIEISIRSVDKAKQFVNITSKYSEDIDLIDGRYVVDAKSIMGVFCLDLSKRSMVRIHTDDVNITNKFFGELDDAGFCIT